MLKGNQPTDAYLEYETNVELNSLMRIFNSRHLRKIYGQSKDTQHSGDTRQGLLNQIKHTPPGGKNCPRFDEGTQNPLLDPKYTTDTDTHVHFGQEFQNVYFLPRPRPPPSRILSLFCCRRGN
jgi:hypothetical protein